MPKKAGLSAPRYAACCKDFIDRLGALQKERETNQNPKNSATTPPVDSGLSRQSQLVSRKRPRTTSPHRHDAAIPPNLPGNEIPSHASGVTPREAQPPNASTTRPSPPGAATDAAMQPTRFTHSEQVQQELVNQRDRQDHIDKQRRIARNRAIERERPSATPRKALFVAGTGAVVNIFGVVLGLRHRRQACARSGVQTAEVVLVSAPWVGQGSVGGGTEKEGGCARPLARVIQQNKGDVLDAIRNASDASHDLLAHSTDSRCAGYFAVGTRCRSLSEQLETIGPGWATQVPADDGPNAAKRR
ncbi:hypothetical protein QBC46DRAFT_454639 [Diplogelasinospora grovesii]|uniref:Uncharacterized protein n=1 Tax=Diplogelasinospora grovesii TaxID=303347 RepID=A0AAN6MXJ0_9PEZI|nr:hypothetical protein QBC46DRAFT_454639 [Diplogelasinospora grovesii]